MLWIDVSFYPEEHKRLGMSQFICLVKDKNPTQVQGSQHDNLGPCLKILGNPNMYENPVGARRAARFRA